MSRTPGDCGSGLPLLPPGAGSLRLSRSPFGTSSHSCSSLHSGPHFSSSLAPSSGHPSACLRPPSPFLPYASSCSGILSPDPQAMAGPFSRLLAAHRGLRLLALAGAGSLAAGFLLRPESVRATSERRRLYPPRYQCLRRRGWVGR